MYQNQNVQRLLVVSKDCTFSKCIERIFREHDYLIESAENEEIGTAKAMHLPYDLVILEKTSTGTIDLIRILREKNITTPIVVIAEQRMDAMKKNCLEAGADMLLDRSLGDDYIFTQILAFVRRINPEKEKKILIKNLQLNANKLQAVYKRRKISLRRKEFALLAYLASHPNTVFTRKQLYRHVWNKDEIKSNTVDAHINKIRKKLGEDTDTYIRTIHSKGYSFVT
jgi:DNA-binding response OmpR family regulator